MTGLAVDTSETRCTVTLPDGQQVEFIVESDGVNPPEYRARLTTMEGVRLDMTVQHTVWIDGIREVHPVEDTCCECGSTDHTCDDCPTFQDDGD